MKVALGLVFLSVASAIKLGDDDEFAKRREELQRTRVDKLTDVWQSRVDNYDPDLD